MKKITGIAAVALMLAASAFTVSAAEDTAADYLEYYHQTGNYESGYCARFEAEAFRESFGNGEYWSENQFTNASGGKNVIVAGSEDDNMVFTIKVEVPVTGYYQFGAAVADRVFASPTAVSFNGSGYEDIRYNTGNTTETAQSDKYTRVVYSNDGDTYGTNLYIRNEAVLLNEGENTIAIKPGKRIEDNPRVFAAVDFIDLSLIRADYGNVYEAEEAADYLGLTNAEEATASMGHAAQYSNAGETNKEITFTVNVKSTGVYTLKIGAALQANHNWLSPSKLVVNNGDEIDLDYTKMTQYVFTALHGNTYSPALYTLEDVELKEGANEFRFKLTERSSGGIYFAVDFIDFYKTGEISEPVTAKPMTAMSASAEFEHEGEMVRNIGFKLENISIDEYNQYNNIEVTNDDGSKAHYRLSDLFNTVISGEGEITLGLQINNVPTAETITGVSIVHID